MKEYCMLKTIPNIHKTPLQSILLIRLETYCYSVLSRPWPSSNNAFFI